MPAKTTRRTISRQWELLKHLPSRGAGKTASELAHDLVDAGFKVSKRQVERDLWELYESFHIECNEKSVPYGWKWPAGASLDIPGMTLAEALSLRLVKTSVQQLLPVSLLHVLEPRFALAEKKLASIANETAAATWPDKIRTVLPTQPFIAPTILPEVLESVQDALLADKQIDVDYLAMGAEQPQSMRLNPLAMVVRGPVTYLIATAWGYTDVRLFVLHRFASAVCLEESCIRPKDFDLDVYIAGGALQFGSGKTLELRMRVSDALARILEETPLSADQSIDGDKLTATVQDTWQLKWWILSQGEAIEVIQPEILREQVSNELANALAPYAGSNTI